MTSRNISPNLLLRAKNLKVNPRSCELDINASQACLTLFLVFITHPHKHFYWHLRDPVRWTQDGLVRVKYGQRRFILQGGHQVGLQGGPQGVLQGVFHGVESFQMDSGRGNMGQEWSGVVSAEVKREYLTLQVRLHN